MKKNLILSSKGENLSVKIYLFLNLKIFKMNILFIIKNNILRKPIYLTIHVKKIDFKNVFLRLYNKFGEEP